MNVVQTWIWTLNIHIKHEGLHTVWYIAAIRLFISHVYRFWFDGFEMRARLMHKMHVAVCRTLWLVFISTSHTLSHSPTNTHTVSLKHTSVFWKQRMHLTCFFHLLLSVLLFSSAFSIFHVFFFYFHLRASSFFVCHIISSTIYL